MSGDSSSDDDQKLHWANFYFPEVVRRSSLFDALDDLILALERHRYLFIFCAGARRGRSRFWDEYPYARDHKIEPDKIDTEGKFLLGYRHVWEMRINTFVEYYGPLTRIAKKPEDQPCWVIDDWAALHLEDSANTLVKTVAYLARMSADLLIKNLRDSVLAITHAPGQNRWYSCNSFAWSFVDSIDKVIRESKLLLASELHEYPPEKIGVEPLGTSQSEIQPFQVMDEATNKMVCFDPSNCQAFPGETRYEDYDFGGDPNYIVNETVYLHKDKSWTLIVSRQHVEANWVNDPIARRIDDLSAVSFITLNGLKVPNEYKELASEFQFAPGKPSLVAEQLPTSSPKPEIAWNKFPKQLTVNGVCAKEIRSLSNAVNVVKILEFFQDDEWPDRVDSPFNDDEAGKERLRDSVRSLNRNLLFLHFESDGDGQGVILKVLNLPEAPGSSDESPDVPF